MPKGRGITAARAFQAKEFVCGYDGDLLTKDAARQREAAYRKDKKIGSYLFFFDWKNTELW